MRRKVQRASSEFSYFGVSLQQIEQPLLSFRGSQDYEWLDELWRDLKPMKRVEVLLHEYDAKGRGLLIKAVRHKEHHLIHSLLLNARLAVNKQDVYGNTALHHAVLVKDETALSALLLCPRIRCDTVNRDEHTAFDLIDTSDLSLSVAVRVLCYARLVMDRCIVDYSKSHRENITLAQGEPVRMNAILETVRQVYGYSWFIDRFREKDFPQEEITLDLQNKIIAHHFALLST